MNTAGRFCRKTTHPRQNHGHGAWRPALGRPRPSVVSKSMPPASSCNLALFSACGAVAGDAAHSALVADQQQRIAPVAVAASKACCAVCGRPTARQLACQRSQRVPSHAPSHMPTTGNACPGRAVNIVPPCLSKNLPPACSSVVSHRHCHCQPTSWWPLTWTRP